MTGSWRYFIYPWWFFVLHYIIYSLLYHHIVLFIIIIIIIRSIYFLKYIFIIIIFIMYFLAFKTLMQFPMFCYILICCLMHLKVSHTMSTRARVCLLLHTANMPETAGCKPCRGGGGGSHHATCSFLLGSLFAPTMISCPPRWLIGTNVWHIRSSKLEIVS